MKKEGFVFQPLSPMRNSEKIALQIEESIITKRYKPNDRLPPERELAAQFNAGRGAVREALRRLEGLGFIYVKPGRDGGIFVKELDSSGMNKTLIDLVRIGDINLNEITVTRILIETKILELCIDSLKDGEIEALEQNIRACEELMNNKRSVFGKHQNFHILLASYCKNQLLKYFLNAIVEISDTFVRSHTTGWQHTPPSHIEHHKTILKALKDRDINLAKKALLHHLKAVDARLEKYHQRTE
jgi:GntR family transcriptional repressor for pyruvate dehydrogenase complex